MDNWLVLEDLLIQFRDVNLQINRLVELYEHRVIELFSKIKESDFINSDQYLEELFELQNELAIAVYKYEFKLPKLLDEFTYDFDRQDEGSKRYWYEKIKKGEYPLKENYCPHE